MLERMTIDGFTREIGNRLEAFEVAIRLATAEGVDGFVGDRFERRTFDDWLAEFEAWEGSRATRMLDRRKGLTLVRRVV